MYHDSIQWTGRNFQEVEEFAAKYIKFNYDKQQLIVQTSLGEVICNKGDYIQRFKDEYGNDVVAVITNSDNIPNAIKEAQL